jgi:hypothetical protein
MNLIGAHNLPLVLAVSDQLIVGIVTIFFVAGVLITAILRYKVDEFVKFWAAIGTVIGVALGSVGTYFFAKQQVESTTNQLRATEVALQISESQKNEAATRITQLSNALVDRPKDANTLNQINRLLRREYSPNTMFFQQMQEFFNKYPRYRRAPDSSPTPKTDASPTALPSNDGMHDDQDFNWGGDASPTPPKQTPSPSVKPTP